MNTIRDPISGRTWATPCDLIDQIEATHHAYLRLTLPLLDAMLTDIANRRAMPPVLMGRLQRQFTTLADGLEALLARQEARLFPQIRHHREPAGETAWACRLADSLDELMDRSAREDEDALIALDDVAQCLSDPACLNAGPPVRQLASDIGDLHESLTEHFRVENELLFPAVREMIRAEPLAL
jgi:iron-sulfur cluster repair protein YtfE (RIC family)